MKTLKYILIISLGLNLTSQAQEMLTLDKCREIAVKNSYNIKIAAKHVESAEENIKANQRDFYPFVDAYGSYQYLQEPVHLEVNNQELEGPNNQYQVGLNLSQPLYTGGYLKAKSNIAKFNKALASESMNLASDNVLFSTEIHYWNAVFFKELQKNIDNLKVLIDELVKVVNDKVESELVSRNDLLMVEVKQNEVQLAQYKARKDLKVALMELNRTLGENVNKNIDVNNNELYSVFTVPSYESFDSVLVNRPEYAMQQNLINMNSSSVELVKSQYRPNVMLGIVPYWGDPNSDLLGDGPMYNTAVMANLSVPVFHWGKKKNQVSEKTLQFEASKIELDDLKENISLEVNSALYRVQEATERILITEQSVDKAKENVDIITERYKEGLSPIIVVLDAQASWIQAYNEEVEAKINYFQSLAVYKKAIGEL